MTFDIKYDKEPLAQAHATKRIRKKIPVQRLFISISLMFFTSKVSTSQREEEIKEGKKTSKIPSKNCTEVKYC